MSKKLILFFLIWFIGISAIFIISTHNASISVFIYWIILSLVIFSIWLYKLSSRLVLLFAFSLFILGSILQILTLNSVSETIMRISLLGWLVGLGNAAFEYFFKKK